MKTKISEWGNSHGMRMTAPMLDHLNVKPGVELNIKLTDKGVEIMKNTHSQEYVKTVAQETIDGLLATSEPVKTVDDPYAESGIGYLVIAVNPCKPVLREVPLGTPGCYKTLTDAKEAARQIIQNAIADAKEALTELRQIGIENITYIAL
ncbi:MAG: hypothetical protein HOM14_18865 [Gammaproteobacteria bacterium]|jgi:antitoxin component of MazEF toxin-antitoxin module|nr:hypothetical protein [Gammaproteobacteria bacterium]MBT4075339.1 hypothetical protein [Gammaproteobacteria bacterium]MBT4195793.1 hypothetical protein [Gammaproteobacteria bacterium]MBT4448111.1 hypothetical protein [Gammaproteobacteria bacterium]MBT4860111.1 hypothetical protein [Gammaproteobacteria bacterium]